MKVLNYTGLQNLWTNIKNYITVHTPTKTSDLTNDTGFLTSTDISSKANDSEVLHKAQTETVTGEKTFKKDVKIIDLNADERPGVQFEVNGSFRTFEQAKDSLPDTSSGGIGIGGLSSLWSGWVLDDNTKIQNSMSDYVINDITFGSTHYSSVIELNNYYKVYEETDDIQTDVRGMLRFELSPYTNVEKDHEYWSNPNLYFYAMLDGSGNTILGHENVYWTKAYIGEINCEDIKFGGITSIFDVLKNIQNLSYVFRYSSTALTPSSTNSNTLLDNTDNLKVGDKVIDSSGVLFSITAIDTANSTFTIGTALVDLAQDSDVVHKSGNETVGGVKTFTDNMQLKSNVAEYGVTGGNIQFYLMDKNSVGLSKINQGVYNNGVSFITLQLYGRDSNNQTVTNAITYQYTSSFNNTIILPTDTKVDLGSVGNRWGKIYGIQYYYGSDNVEFSTKFVTTDTNQIISGTKTFLDVPIPFKSSTAELGVTGGNTKIIFTDKNLLNLAGITFGNYGSSKLSYCRFHIYDKDSNNQEVENFIEFSYVNNNQIAYFRPNKSNFVTLGTVNNRWSKVYADEYYYGSSNVEFSQKFVTTDTNQTISGNKTFSSINGVEPSSLSLPSGTLTEQIDISSYFSNTGTGDTNSYTASANGWIYLRLGDISSCQVVLNDSSDRRLWGTSATGNVEQIIIPVLKDATLTTTWVTNSTVNVATARFIPCQGNV